MVRPRLLWRPRAAFVGADGSATLHDGSTVTVSDSHAGAPITRDAAGTLRVDGQPV